MVADNGGDPVREGGLHRFGFYFRRGEQTGTLHHRVPSDDLQLAAGHVALERTFDLEACAYDPGSGNVWVANEEGKKGVTASNVIREYSPVTGAAVRELELPAIYRKCRENFGLESLTISGDGLVLWTCNEEALACDGPRSSVTNGTVVRISKFTRPTTSDDFRFAAMYPYAVPKWSRGSGGMSAAYQRAGVSDLCALPDGTLLVLERELSNDFFVSRICAADFSTATEVSGFAALVGTNWTAAARTVLREFTSGGTLKKLYNHRTGNFEGMCLGPREPQGSHLLVLVADAGDGYTSPRLRTERLLGVESVTLDFAAPPVGKATYAGRGFRFEKGKPVTVTVTGAEGAALRWRLPNNEPSSGTVADGTFTFVPTADDALTWEWQISKAR